MSKATGDLLSYFDAKEVEGSPPPPSWNVAPTQDVPIVAERFNEDSIERHLLVARWGLVPSWAKDIKIGSKLINARSESILEKPSYRAAGRLGSREGGPILLHSYLARTAAAGYRACLSALFGALEHRVGSGLGSPATQRLPNEYSEMLGKKLNTKEGCLRRSPLQMKGVRHMVETGERCGHLIVRSGDRASPPPATKQDPEGQRLRGLFSFPRKRSAYPTAGDGGTMATWASSFTQGSRP